MPRRPFRFFVGALALGVTLALGGGAFPARALGTLAPPDKITLKNGQVIEGKITREVDGFVWFTEMIGSVENTRFLKPDEISKIERSSDTPAEVSATAKVEPAAGASVRAAGSTRRAAVLTLEGEVGTQFCAKPLLDAIPYLEKDGVDIVVLKINSGGGSGHEMKLISDVIQKEYKPRFHTVAWIESAISAAAMGSHCLEEIYFMANGNYGACTGFRMKEKAEAVKGRELEEILLWGQKISALGGHPKEIMRAMQISGDDAVIQELRISPPSGLLSADITENGDVVWHQDLTGTFVLNPQGTLKILTFNSEQAVKFKFARAIANDIHELGKAMGYQELDWVGTTKPGEGFPVCAAEEKQRKWREETTELEENMIVFRRQYDREVASAQAAQDKQDRGAWVQRARVSLNYLRSLWKKYPNFAPSTGFTKEWFEDEEEMLRKLSK